jgi:hypothetical protein
MGDPQPESSYYQIGGFRPSVTLQRCCYILFLLKFRALLKATRDPRGFQYDMRKLAQTIFGSKSTVDLVLGMLSSKISGLVLGRSIHCDRNQTLWGFVHPRTYLRVDQNRRI